MIELPQLLSRDSSHVSMKKLYQLFFPLSSMEAYQVEDQHHHLFNTIKYHTPLLAQPTAAQAPSF